MPDTNPLHTLHEHAEATFLVYGGEGIVAHVVETFGEIETEYAAIRRGCLILDLPHRGVIRAKGADRVAFLNRMLTQELKGLSAFNTRWSFWLNRKGRIDADLKLVELPDEMLIDVDVLNAQQSVSTLTEFVFSEDVTFENVSDSYHRLALHGPRAIELLSAVSQPVSGPALSELAPGHACVVSVDGNHVVVDRDDSTGDCGLELCVSTQHVVAVYERLTSQAERMSESNAGGVVMQRCRPGGWAAYNIARIEAGRPVFNIDFGPDSLPAETGILAQRVSFTKGCYLGQEVVARMHSLGHPKQQLVAVRLSTAGHEDPAWQPHTAAPVYAGGIEITAETKPIGAITSSTRSPMLGDDICCFAAVKWDHSQPGAKLQVLTTLGVVETSVEPTLAFWSRV